jgi:hypothetical protein
LRKKYHLYVNVQKRGLTFAKHIVCESLKTLKSKVGNTNAIVKEHEMKLKIHNKY